MEEGKSYITIKDYYLPYDYEEDYYKIEEHFSDIFSDKSSLRILDSSRKTKIDEVLNIRNSDIDEILNSDSSEMDNLLNPKRSDIDDILNL